MSDSEQSLDISPDSSPDSKKKEENPLEQGMTLDDACLAIAKRSGPIVGFGNTVKLTDKLIEQYVAYLERGTPMSACAMMVGVSQPTVYKWMKEGKAEIEGLTDEQLQSGDYIPSMPAKFYLEVCKAKATPVCALQDMLYEKAFEAGKEWIATYLLERMCPESYNLKYKVQQEVSANVNANVVSFKFVDGPMARSETDREFIDSQLEALKEKYASSDIIDVTPTEDTPDD